MMKRTLMSLFLTVSSTTQTVLLCSSLGLFFRENGPVSPLARKWKVLHSERPNQLTQKTVQLLMDDC